MRLEKISSKCKSYLLILGIVILLILAVSGKLFRNKEKNVENETPIANEELLILGTAETVNGLQANEVYTDRGIYTYQEKIDWSPYIYQSIQAVTENREILHISNLLSREVHLSNCLIAENTESEVTIFSENFLIKLPSKNLTANFQDEIADIYLTNGYITKISTKREEIQGKILSVRAEGIEVEGYGIVPLDESFRFYETYGEYAEKSTAGLIVGYEQAKLVVAEGKICAAVLESPISIERIRVLLKTTNFESILHPEIQLTAHGNYEVICGNETKRIADGEEIRILPSEEGLKENRMILKPENEAARLEVTSIERNLGTPFYAGRMEIVKESDGLILINDVDLETYLYGVVPSEMPASYEMEALKAQAVCARSYAYRQIQFNGYASYGAHVDDSVSYQVYNNLPTDEKVIQAVNETAGMVLKYGEEVATTYYFSTSCGYTTNETIWKDGSEDHTYISGKLLNDSKEQLDLRKEDDFRQFILNEEYETYDSGESWYRWDVTVPLEQITQNIQTLANIGTVEKIEVTERNEGGVVQKVVVYGTKGKTEIEYEHAIRLALNGQGQPIKRTYGKDVTGGTMLPSGFFVLDSVEEEGVLKGFRFRGGGFGHGAGMSQNGANHMAKAGKSCVEILALFYEGTVLENI